MKLNFIEKNMSSWFTKKSTTKNKDNNQQSPIKNQDNNNPFFSSNYHHQTNNKQQHQQQPLNDGVLLPRGSPRVSRDYSSSPSSNTPPLLAGPGSSFGFSGLNSDRIGHPLPQPSISPTTSLTSISPATSLPSISPATSLPSISPTTSLPSISPTTSLPSTVGLVDQNNQNGSGSVSSSGGCSVSSADEHSNNIDHLPLSFFRGNGETKSSPRARSPCPGPRVGGTSTSPLHPRFTASSTTIDSPNKRLDECHPLPLPPSSPTSPCSGLSSNRTCNSPASPSSVLSSNKTLSVAESTNPRSSKWKKGKLLGRGTFGHVYLGFNSESGQMCAIKEVKVVVDDQSSKECLKQLNQEITLLSKLKHPNIVEYYGSEMGEETLSVYLDYVSGGSIHKLLQEYGPFREPVIQNYTRQILSGLAYLHGTNTVHRDIKGANILVDPNGEIKLADFGMAKHISNCTSMLSFKGSPYWMAPEVVMNTNGYNLAVDIWSLGCTVLEMATSKPPWGQYEGVKWAWDSSRRVVVNEPVLKVVPHGAVNDGFVEVNKKNMGTHVKRQVEGIKLSKPKPNFQYRKVLKVDVSKDKVTSSSINCELPKENSNSFSVLAVDEEGVKDKNKPDVLNESDSDDEDLIMENSDGTRVGDTNGTRVGDTNGKGASNPRRQDDNV